MSTPLSQQEVQQRIKETFEQNVNLASPYVNKRTNVLLHCNDCGHEWLSSPATFLYKNKNGGLHHCPHCGVVQKVELQCSYCGATIWRLPSDFRKNTSGNFYCSKTCGNLHKNLLRKESGEWDDSANYRLKALDTYEHKCCVCGWAEDDRILEVHHIDENHSNNNIDNLCILCPTCHRKITLGYYKLDIVNHLLIRNE